MNPTRRSLLLGALTAFALAGCDRAVSTAAIVPLEIDPATTCDLDGMLLADYAGPKAQIFYVGQDKPVFCCDTVEMFSTLLQPEQVRSLQAVFVQDMARADWEQPRGHWIDAKAAWYVSGSKRHGSMGPTFASFQAEGDARHFAASHGGKVLRFAEVTPAMVDLCGGASQHSGM
ncbi:nitrous oxide reductase accessory protein NosL [Eleftheria terrae]|uniref:nitrous oxide reductase accessory protein NosL n=1 Tax=Eleftheria terrae TaxID=1597781 RepID=UPI00263AAA61|nr:nitrous oxide reductase accessory protein NosL [Eleftheria terrae]WKB55410.1 nitrous oxide reductase accessory protein NosL [Eleftheria terrae]